jgi:glucan biosynthesis protein C
MNSSKGAIARRYDLDWLRVLTILTVFIFHSGRFFDQGDWHVKNPTTYFGMDVWTAFLADWMMPFIFIISGASLYYAISKGGVGKFVKDKVSRLAVPLVVGVFTHAALMVYLERLTHHQFSGSFWQFLPHYFEGWYGFGGNFAWMGLHLWYLLILFVFSLLLYPLFRWLRGGGSAMLSAVCGVVAYPGVVYALALPVMILAGTLNPDSFAGMRSFGGWSLIPYAVFFVYGFIIISSLRLQERIQQLRGVSLVGGILTAIGTFLLHGTGADPYYGTLQFALVYATFALSAWCWILALLGYGMRSLTRNTPFLQYTNEAVLPFYVMHQTVLLSVGYFVVQTTLPDPLKWFVIALISFAIVLGLYEFLVRRINLLRILFGMKPLRKAVVLSPQSARVAQSH